MLNNKYQNAKIYQVVDVGYNKSYIGSTCESLSKRMTRHREAYKKQLQGNRVDTTASRLFDEFGIKNCKIELIENYPCESKEELLKREGHFISTKDCVNRCLSGRERKDWLKDNQEHIKEQQKEYYRRHFDNISKNSKEYKEKHKEWYKAYYRDYYERNKEHLKEARRKRYAIRKEDT